MSIVAWGSIVQVAKNHSPHHGKVGIVTHVSKGGPIKSHWLYTVKLSDGKEELFFRRDLRVV